MAHPERVTEGVAAAVWGGTLPPGCWGSPGPTAAGSGEAGSSPAPGAEAGCQHADGSPPSAPQFLAGKASLSSHALQPSQQP